ncbi:MAG TPA: HIT family hydrolase [Bacteroidetes bacterium]|nr:HIT family hydrolase [Bacteroidota bacterium]HRK03838.1 HIT domain-containing protein [Chlorobiota bacterium]
MEHLWSPWRSSYVAAQSEQRGSGCFLCDASADEPSRENLVVYTTESVVVLLNAFPYNAGHLLIAPREHVGDLDRITQGVAQDLMSTVQHSSRVIKHVLKPHGLNIGANLGASAGAGVPDHLHFHIVPRWNGDTNFMPVLADIKVVSASMDDLFAKFTSAFAETSE